MTDSARKLLLRFAPMIYGPTVLFGLARHAFMTTKVPLSFRARALALLGGTFRLAPELLKWLDRPGERGHELSMHDKALEFEKLRGAQRMDEIVAGADAAWNVGAIETLREAVRTQGEKSVVRWADALSSSVRPVITYWFMALYCAAKTAAFVAAIEGGADWGVAIVHAWTDADQALWAGVLNFWFLGRVFDRVRS